MHPFRRSKKFYRSASFCKPLIWDFQNVGENEESALHMELSCKTVLLIKSEILTYRASYPQTFVSQIIQVVQNGQESANREEFSRLCFEIASGLR